MDNDGFISNGELFQVLKMMVGNNLKVGKSKFNSESKNPNGLYYVYDVLY